jgi:hypothetical protein
VCRGECRVGIGHRRDMAACGTPRQEQREHDDERPHIMFDATGLHSVSPDWLPFGGWEFGGAIWRRTAASRLHPGRTWTCAHGSGGGSD